MLRLLQSIPDKTVHAAGKVFTYTEFLGYKHYQLRVYY